MPATKTARSAATITMLAPAVHLVEALVVLPPAYRGGDPRPRKVTLRLDGREPEGWHVDLCDLGLWETILPLTADGRQPFPTRRAAEKHARAWIRAAREQGTLQPRMECESAPASIAA